MPWAMLGALSPGPGGDPSLLITVELIPGLLCPVWAPQCERDRDILERAKHEETFLFLVLVVSEGDQAPGQVAQGGGGVSLFRDVQKLPGRGPGQACPDGYLPEADLNHSRVLQSWSGSCS